MNQNPNLSDLCRAKVVLAVVDRELGREVGKAMRALGAKTATAFHARGTANKTVLKALGLNDVARVICLSVVPKEKADALIVGIAEQFHMDKPSHGIAFMQNVSDLIGAVSKAEPEEGEVLKANRKYELILTIVDRGFAEEAVEAAREAGATGGTIINARGIGVHEDFSFFGVPIEPEKEIVLSLVKREITDAVIRQVEKNLKLDKPGKGICFVMPVDRAVGITSTK
ncbi:P-II family nitrogen regulator [Oscillospiraceae bacterium OttesenSCG-928-F05]|nr:P-II family nitrogen regulator [Oscillospiraceae bacterium OttesenSCG-928-F05]